MKDEFEVFADRFFTKLRELEISQLDDAAPDVTEELAAKKKLLADLLRVEYGSRWPRVEDAKIPDGQVTHRSPRDLK